MTESGTTESKNYAYTVNTETGYKDAIKSALGTSFSGTTDEEYVAAVLALKDTEGAVQKRLARARGKLRCNLRESEAAI